LFYYITENTNPNSGVSIDANRYVDITPVANWFGISDVVITVNDGIKSHSDVFRVTVDPPVPVELSSFTANTIGRDIILNWVTQTETNNYGFEIERSKEVLMKINLKKSDLLRVTEQLRYPNIISLRIKVFKPVLIITDLNK